MKVVAFILSMVVTTALAVGGIFLICSLTPDAQAGPVILASAALSVLTFGPLMLGSVTAYFDVRTSSYSRRTFRLWLLVIGGLEVAAGVCIVAYSMLSGAPAWVPALFIGAAVVLTLVSLGAGRWLFEHERARSTPHEAWAPVTPDDVRRKTFIVAGTFAISLVIATVTLILAGRPIEPRRVAPMLLLAVGLAFFAASFACSMVTLKLQRRLRGLADNELGQTRKFTKVILGRKPVELDDEEERAAAKFAVLLPTILGFQLASIVLLYVALVLQQVSLSVRGGVDAAFLIGIWFAMGAMLAWLIPLQARRIGRARTYARDHADLLPSTAEVPGVSAPARSDASPAQAN